MMYETKGLNNFVNEEIAKRSCEKVRTPLKSFVFFFTCLNKLTFYLYLNILKDGSTTYKQIQLKKCLAKIICASSLREIHFSCEEKVRISSQLYYLGTVTEDMFGMSQTQHLSTRTHTYCKAWGWKCHGLGLLLWYRKAWEVLLDRWSHHEFFIVSESA